MTRTQATLTLAFVAAVFSAVAGCKGDPNDMAIDGIEPPNGNIQGEQPVVLNGKFRTDLGYTVYFGTKRSDRVSVRDSESLVAVSPRQDEAGAVDVTIIADNGAAYRIRNGFVYEAGGGNVVEHLGSGPQQREGQGSGNLAY